MKQSFLDGLTHIPLWLATNLCKEQGYLVLEVAQDTVIPQINRPNTIILFFNPSLEIVLAELGDGSELEY